jgi:hypothetical protein
VTVWHQAMTQLEVSLNRMGVKQRLKQSGKQSLTGFHHLLRATPSERRSPP